MNKKHIGWLLCIPAFLGLGLTSCSDEEALVVKETAKEMIVDVQVTADLSNPTRATFTPDQNILKFGWESTDVIKVVDGDNGKYLGELKVKEVLQDVTKCTFQGKLTVTPKENYQLKFYYLGKDGELTKSLKDNVLVAESVEVDFSNQNGKANFASHDFLKSEGTFTQAQVASTNLGYLNFTRDFAYGRFILKYNGEALNIAGKDVTISANTGTLYNKGTLDPQTAAYSYESGDLKIKIAATARDKDFYVSFFPSTVNLKFTVDMGDDGVFEGTKGEKLESNIYYTNGDDNTGKPIIVEMQNVSERNFVIEYYANDGTQDKWTDNQKGVGTTLEYNVQGFDNIFDTTAPEGYEFDGWNTAADGSGDDYTPGTKYDIDLPGLTLYAKWKAKSYTWLFRWIDDPNDGVGDGFYGASREKGALPKTLGSAFPAENPNNEKYYQSNKKEGYDFDRWEYKGNRVTKAADIVVNSLDEAEFDRTENAYIVKIYAKWQKKMYDVDIKWVDDEGRTVLSMSPKVPHGTEINVTENQPKENPTKIGYDFAGWVIKGTTDPAPEIITVTNNVTLVLEPTWNKKPIIGLTGYDKDTFNK